MLISSPVRKCKSLLCRPTAAEQTLHSCTLHLCNGIELLTQFLFSSIVSRFCAKFISSWARERGQEEWPCSPSTAALSWLIQLATVLPRMIFPARSSQGLRQYYGKKGVLTVFEHWHTLDLSFHTKIPL